MVIKLFRSNKIKRNIVSLFQLVFIINTIFSITTIKAHAEEIDYSPIFNAEFYADSYEDLKEAYGYNEVLLFQHFLRVGMDEGRQASEEFNVQSYRARYYNIRRVYGENLKLYYYHYLYIGKAEGRDGSYDEKLYFRTYPTTSKKYDEIVSKITKEDVDEYYDKAVFIGDSIMTGFCYYANTVSESCVAKSDFLAQNSFAIFHALKPVEEDEHQPMYMGEKKNVWEQIPLMDVDKVFLMFGTNDMVIYTPSRVCENYFTLIDKLKETNPDVEIYVISMTSTYPGVTKGNLNNMNIIQMNTYMEMEAPYKGYKFVELNKYVSDGIYNQITDYSSDKFVHHTMSSYRNAWEKAFVDYATNEIAYEVISGKRDL